MVAFYLCYTQFEDRKLPLLVTEKPIKMIRDFLLCNITLVGIDSAADFVSHSISVERNKKKNKNSM